MRAKIKIKNNVQDVGLRSIATAVLIENGIKRAKVLNDEKDKTIVNIILDEDEKTLSNIVKALNREFKNREEYPQLPEQFTISDWEETDSNPETLPDLSPYASDALQLRQMSKFVGVGMTMGNSINTMGNSINTMGNSINTMGNSINTMGKSIDSMKNSIDDLKDTTLSMKDSIGGMKNSIDALPKNMAREIANLKKSGLFNQ